MRIATSIVNGTSCWLLLSPSLSSWGRPGSRKPPCCEPQVLRPQPTKFRSSATQYCFRLIVSVSWTASLPERWFRGSSRPFRFSLAWRFLGKNNCRSWHQWSSWAGHFLGVFAIWGTSSSRTETDASGKVKMLAMLVRQRPNESRSRGGRAGGPQSIQCKVSWSINILLTDLSNPFGFLSTLPRGMGFLVEMFMADLLR